MTPKQIFQKLLDKASHLLANKHLWKRHPNPGDLVKSLSEEEIKELQSLKLEEVNDVREEDIKLWVESPSLPDRIKKQK